MASKYIVRHGAMRLLGEYEAGEAETYCRGDEVVIRSDRGHEIGQVLCEANPQAVELIKEATRGPIVRSVSPEDRQQLERLRGSEPQELERCCLIRQERQRQTEHAVSA